jgi:hypothetical protein
VRNNETADTFLFADLAGFTALSEAMGDEEAADLVGAFCSAASDLLPQYDDACLTCALSGKQSHSEASASLLLRTRSRRGA